MKELICINCPRGCRLSVDDNLKVTGNFCPRGAQYAINELTHPVRVLTSTVKTNSNEIPRCPVKTDKPIPKEMLFKAMEEINKTIISLPIKQGDIVIKGICGTDINIISTKTIEKGD